MKQDIAVLKVPMDMVGNISVENWAREAGLTVIIMPLDWELLLGKMAKEELERTHKHIHELLKGAKK